MSTEQNPIADRLQFKVSAETWLASGQALEIEPATRGISAAAVGVSDFSPRQRKPWQAMGFT